MAGVALAAWVGSAMLTPVEAPGDGEGDDEGRDGDGDGEAAAAAETGAVSAGASPIAASRPSAGA